MTGEFVFLWVSFKELCYSVVGYALDPTNDIEGPSVVGSLLAMEESGGKTVFESTKARPLDKRKRKKNDDPSDIDGFLGPWAPYEDEKKDIKPTAVSFSC